MFVLQKLKSLSTIRAFVFGEQMTSQVLPRNEAQRFTNMMNMVENKRYTKALKTADEILKKFPNHGETYAAKGLIKYYLKQTEEGYNLIRKGLRINIASSISWHMLATVYRDEKCRYKAVQCYSLALALDSDNELIMRNYAISLIHIRDYAIHNSIRIRLFNARPEQRINWLFMAISADLHNFHNHSLEFINQIESNFFAKAPNPDDWEGKLERSQLSLYKIRIFRKLGNTAAALDYVRDKKSQILDQTDAQQVEAELLIELNKLSEAREHYRELLKFNPNNLDYHRKIHETFSISIDGPLTEDQIELLQGFYDEFSLEFPKEIVFKQLPLFYWTPIDKFKSQFVSFIRPLLSKDIPSLWKILKPLYKIPEKLKIVEQYIFSCEESLTKNNTFPDSDEECGPTSLLWVYYFLAQHFKLSDFSKSLYYIDLAIKHTPTIIDFYVFKASLHKLVGNYLKSAELMELARTLDLRDRCLNNKSVKYWLRADQIEKATENFSIFTKIDRATYNNAYSMQIMCIETYLAESYERTDQLALALKFYNNVNEHFTEFSDDEIDFHNYCVRKMTLNTYRDLLDCQFKEAEFKWFARSLGGLARIQLLLHKARKNMTQKQIDAMNQKCAASHNSALESLSATKTWDKKHDLDPTGNVLYAKSNPILLASSHCSSILKCSKKDLDLLLLCIKVFSQCDKPLLALGALLDALKIVGVQNAKTHYMLVYFLKWWKSVDTVHHEAVNSAIWDHLKSYVTPKTCLLEYNMQWIKSLLQSNSATYADQFTAAKIIAKWSPVKSYALELLMDVEDSVVSDVCTMIDAKKIVSKYFPDQIDDFDNRIHSRHPYADTFGPKNDIVSQT